MIRVHGAQHNLEGLNVSPATPSPTIALIGSLSYPGARLGEQGLFAGCFRAPLRREYVRNSACYWPDFWLLVWLTFAVAPTDGWPNLMFRPVR